MRTFFYGGFLFIAALTGHLPGQAGQGAEGEPDTEAAQPAVTASPPMVAVDRDSIANRPALEEEWGYHPPDGEQVVLNPPSLSWVIEDPDRNAYTGGPFNYTVELANNPGFREAISVQNIPWPTYTPNKTLAAGRWYWRYRLTTNSKGVPSNWSQTRTFTISAQAVALPCPTREEQKELVPAAHPRLFLRPEALGRMRETARTNPAFAKLQKETDKMLKKGLPAEPNDQNGFLRQLKARHVSEVAQAVAFVYLITGESKYGETTRTMLLRMAGWDPVKGPTAYLQNDYAGWAMMTGLSRGYDWGYQALSPAERGHITANLQLRGRQIWDHYQLGRGVKFISRPFGSHAQITWQRQGEMAIAAYSEVPEAALWLDHAVQVFLLTAPSFGDNDGGWSEGLHYYFTIMQDLVRWMELQKAALNLDGMHKPFFHNAADLPLYLAPPGSPHAGFGDMNFHPPYPGGPSTDNYWVSFMSYLQRQVGTTDPAKAAHWRWWATQWQTTNRLYDVEGGILEVIRSATLPPLPEPRAPSDLPPSKIFRGTGIASFHTTLLDSSNDIHFAFKASPAGSQSHGIDPQNSFFLNAFGDPLLETMTYRDQHLGPFHLGWVCTTRAHNCVLVNGQGQEVHSARARGEIVDSKLTPDFDYVQGDAAPAYAGKLKRFRRHVAFVKPAFIVIYDDLAAAQPSTFQWLLHAGAPFKIAEAAQSLQVERTTAGLDARYLPPAPLVFKQWDGFDPVPKHLSGLVDKADFPNQWHVEAATASPSALCHMLTVLVPYKLGEHPDWSAQRVETPDAIGVRMQLGGKTRIVAFQKSGAARRAKLEAFEFDGPVGVE